MHYIPTQPTRSSEAPILELYPWKKIGNLTVGHGFILTGQFLRVPLSHLTIVCKDFIAHRPVGTL